MVVLMPGMLARATDSDLSAQCRRPVVASMHAHRHRTPDPRVRGGAPPTLCS
ncbi:hypothetical protein ACFPRL_30660 [Pseudoclavibacter helvolus]